MIQPSHNPRTCALCAPLRHPANQKTRRALAAIPRPSAPAGPRQNGGRS